MKVKVDCRRGRISKVSLSECIRKKQQGEKLRNFDRSKGGCGVIKVPRISPFWHAAKFVAGSLPDLFFGGVSQLQALCTLCQRNGTATLNGPPFGHRSPHSALVGLKTFSLKSSTRLAHQRYTSGSPKPVNSVKCTCMYIESHSKLIDTAIFR